MSTKCCPHCGEVKDAAEFYRDFRRVGGLQSWCKSCTREYRIAHRDHFRNLVNESHYKTGRRKPLGTNPNCASYLGVYVAERVLSHIFDHVKRMPTNNPGFDFVCGRGYKIDVKSSTRQRCHPNTWLFNINRNATADYFLCIAFDDRNHLNPEHLWLLPAQLVGLKKGASISESTLCKWSPYELHDKFEKVVTCCGTIRGDSRA